MCIVVLLPLLCIYSAILYIYLVQKYKAATRYRIELGHKDTPAAAAAAHGHGGKQTKEAGEGEVVGRRDKERQTERLKEAFSEVGVV